MKKPALLLTLITLVSVPLLGQLAKYGKKRTNAPKGWTKFEWPEKKKILFGHYAPTQAELELVAKASPTTATAKPKKERKILLFYKTDYPHTSIATGVAAFEKMAETSGAYSIVSSDQESDFSTENLAQYDAILLNNTVNFETFLNDDQKQALLDFVEGGKGLIGIHAASDSCKKWRPGAQMIGGVFRCHPWNAKGTWPAKLESPDHPLNKAWKGEGPWLRDEIYLYRDNTFKRDRSRILMSIDTSKTRITEGRFLASNQRHLVDPKETYPIAWLHQHGKGRVFYSNLGHNNFTFWNPVVLQHYLDGIQYALGDLPADATPSSQIAPEDLKIAPAKAKRIIFLAGAKSHRSGDHEFRAGSLLLAQRLNEQDQLPIQADVISGWPTDDTVLDGADAIVIYCDSDSIHRKQYTRLMELSKAGTGLFFLHYGVHPKKVEDGQNYYMPTVGGFMETGFSVNPHWAAELKAVSNHPVRRGCEKPIHAFDEFYYNMRFAEDTQPLLTAIPRKERLIPINLWNENGPAGFGKPQTLMWGFEKPDGTRGGGFTGGHYHRNWAIDGFRKVVLNAIVWTAGCEVPPQGIRASGVTEEQINANLDQKKPMRKITFPIKGSMVYHQEMIDAKKARKAEKKSR